MSEGGLGEYGHYQEERGASGTKVHNLVLFIRNIDARVDFRINQEVLPVKSRIICMMDRTGRVVYCGGLTPSDRINRNTIAMHIRQAVGFVREHYGDADFGNVCDPEFLVDFHSLYAAVEAALGHAPKFSDRNDQHFFRLLNEVFGRLGQLIKRTVHGMEGE